MLRMVEMKRHGRSKSIDIENRNLPRQLQSAAVWFIDTLYKEVNRFVSPPEITLNLGDKETPKQKEHQHLVLH